MSQSGGTIDLTRLKKLVMRQDFDELETAWLAALEEGEIALGGLLSVLEGVSARDENGRADQLAWFMLTELAEKEGPQAEMKALLAAAPYLKGTDSIRQETCTLFGRIHGDREGLDRMLDMTVRRDDLPFPQATERLELLLALKPGTFVRDNWYKEPGRVRGLSPDRAALVIEFPEEISRNYDAKALERVTVQPPDDFLAVITYTPDRLAQLAKDDPRELIRMVLRTYGPRMETRDLKSRLAPAVPTKSWGRWFSGIKAQLKRDPMIEMSDDSQPVLVLRSKPVAFDQERKASFNEADGPQAKLGEVLDYLHELHEGNEPHVDLLQFYGEQLRKMIIELQPKQPAMALSAAALLDDLPLPEGDQPKAVPVLPELLEACGDRAAIIPQIADERLVEHVLNALRHRLPDQWPQVYVEMLPGASANSGQIIADTLAGEGHAALLAPLVSQTVERPHRAPALLVWLWKVSTTGNGPQELGQLDQLTIAARLLMLANEMARAGTVDQNMVAAIRSALSSRNFQALDQVISKTDNEGAERVRHVLHRNAAFSDLHRGRILELLRRHHPTLFLEIIPPWEENVVYTTAEGLQRKQEEFTELCNVKVPANARAIGEAAARGDLSENAEFTAALEERDRLGERAGAMQEDLEKSRIIPPTMADSDTVTVGSGVKVRNLDTGEESTWRFLGPWDGDLPRGIYSYRAALAMAFMGHATGDEVELSVEDGIRRWQILEIFNGLRDD